MNIYTSEVEYLRNKVKQLEEALAQPEQEPVAWRHDMGEENGGWEYFEQASCPDCQPLYTTPPQRKPLTDEQIGDIAALFYPRWQGQEGFARAIEAAHGIKE